MIAVIGLSVAGVILVTADRPTPTDFQVPSHARVHGGAPVPDLRFGPLPNGLRYDGGPDEGSRGPGH